MSGLINNDNDEEILNRVLYLNSHNDGTLTLDTNKNDEFAMIVDPTERDKKRDELLRQQWEQEHKQVLDYLNSSLHKLMESQGKINTYAEKQARLQVLNELKKKKIHITDDLHKSYVCVPIEDIDELIQRENS